VRFAGDGLLQTLEAQLNDAFIHMDSSSTTAPDTRDLKEDIQVTSYKISAMFIYHNSSSRGQREGTPFPQIFWEKTQYKTSCYQMQFPGFKMH